MSDRVSRLQQPTDSYAESGEPQAFIDSSQGAPAPAGRSPIASVLIALRRSRGWVLLWIIGGFTLACAGIFSLEPRYRATALIMLDNRELNLGAGGAVLSNPLVTIDSSIARGEVEVLGSESLARRVVADMGLANLHDAARKPSSWRG